MILTIVTVVYCGQKLFVPHLLGNGRRYASRLYFPYEMGSDQFLAFGSADKARKVIIEKGGKYKTESQYVIDIDNLITWTQGHGAITVNEIMLLDSFILDYIEAYRGALPKSFGDYLKNVGELIQRDIGLFLVNLYVNMKKNAQLSVDLAEIKAISEEDIASMLNAPELKQAAEVRLDFFKAHLKIKQNADDVML
jgi:hypothetical protein